MPPPTDAMHVDAVLTNMSVKYSNEEFIADRVLPIVKVMKRSGLYFVYDKDNGFRLMDSAVGPKAQPNEVEWNVSTANYSVTDHALADYVPAEDVDNADNPLKPRADTNNFLNEWLALGREKRVADLVFNENTYADSNTETLATKWGTDGDDPIGDVERAIRGCFMKANVLIFGEDAWSAFRKLPKVLDAVKGSTRHQDHGGGLAMRKEVAELFEVEEVLVGSGRYISSKKGQADVFTRLWGKHMSATHRKQNPGTRSITFGMTFQEMMKQTQSMFDPKRGAKGAEYLKVGYNCDERIVAPDLGYFLKSVIA